MSFKNSRLVSIALYMILIALTVLPLVMAHFTISFWVEGQWKLSLAAGFTLVFVAILAVVGWRLHRFIRAVIVVADEGLNITIKGACVHYGWSDIGPIRDSRGWQLLRIYDCRGQLILAVDHHLVRYAEFKWLLDEKISAKI